MVYSYLICQANRNVVAMRSFIRVYIASGFVPNIFVTTAGICRITNEIFLILNVNRCLIMEILVILKHISIFIDTTNKDGDCNRCEEVNSKRVGKPITVGIPSAWTRKLTTEDNLENFVNHYTSVNDCSDSNT